MPDQTLNFIPPWEAVELAPDRATLEAQVHREVGPGHELDRRTVRAVARRIDRDDVLVDVGRGKWAIVHLTWTDGPSADPRWPTAVLYGSETELAERLVADAKAFNEAG